MKKRRRFWVSIGEFIKNVQFCAATSTSFTTKEKENIESKIKEMKNLIETSELNDEVLLYAIKFHQLDLCFMAGKIGDPADLEMLVAKCAEILEAAASKIPSTRRRSPPDGAAE